MFDPSIIIINKIPLYALKTLGITLGFELGPNHAQVFKSSLRILVWFGFRKVWFGFGKCENLGLRPRFSTLPSGPCESSLQILVSFV